MRLLMSITAITVAAMLAAAPASAQSTGMKNGSANASMTKAVCSPGDPNVMVNIKTKTYMMDQAANKAAMTAKSASSMKTMGSMKGDASDPSGSTSTMKSMCKSEATSMGAKMASGTMKKSQ